MKILSILFFFFLLSCRTSSSDDNSQAAQSGPSAQAGSVAPPDGYFIVQDPSPAAEAAAAFVSQNPFVPPMTLALGYPGRLIYLMLRSGPLTQIPAEGYLGGYMTLPDAIYAVRSQEPARNVQLGRSLVRDVTERALPIIESFAQSMVKIDGALDTCQGTVVRTADGIPKIAGEGRNKGTANRSGCALACTAAFVAGCEEIMRRPAGVIPIIHFSCSTGGHASVPMGYLSCVPFMLP